LASLYEPLSGVLEPLDDKLQVRLLLGHRIIAEGSGLVDAPPNVFWIAFEQISSEPRIVLQPSLVGIAVVGFSERDIPHEFHLLAAAQRGECHQESENTWHGAH
jgi:hypothetical protein